MGGASFLSRESPRVFPYPGNRRMTKCLVAFIALILLTTAIACGGLRAGATSTPSARIDGLVIDADGEPAEGVRVQVGQTAVMTDAEGRFAFDGVAPRYDAALAIKNTPHAYVFQGLSTRAPTLRVFDVALSSRSHETTVRAALPASGTDGLRVAIVAASSDGAARIADVRPTEAADEGDGQHLVDVAVRWIGGAAARVTLYAIAYEADATTQAPAHYAGIATLRDAVLEDSRPASWTIADYAPVGERTIRSHIAAQPSHELAWTSLFVQLGPASRRAKIADYALGDHDIQFVVPDLPNATFSMQSFAHAGGDLASTTTTELTSRAANAYLELPCAPSLRSPAEGAALATDTELSWNPLGATRTLADGDVSWLYLGPSDQTSRSEPQVWIATAEHFVKLPDLRALGLELPRHSSGVWYVVAASDATTVEEAAEAGLFREGAGAGGNTGARRFVHE